MPRRTLAAAAVLLLATGCGKTSHPAASTPAPTRSAPAPTPTPSGTPFPTAADGTKLSACDDGKCEVLVSVHDVIHPPARYGLRKLTIKSIGKDGLTVVGTSPGAMVSFSGQQPGRTSTLNGLPVKTVALRDDQAIIRLGH